MSFTSGRSLPLPSLPSLLPLHQKYPPKTGTTVSAIPHFLFSKPFSKTLLFLTLNMYPKILYVPIAPLIKVISFPFHKTPLSLLHPYNKFSLRFGRLPWFLLIILNTTSCSLITTVVTRGCILSKQSHKFGKCLSRSRHWSKINSTPKSALSTLIMVVNLLRFGRFSPQQASPISHHLLIRLNTMAYPKENIVMSWKQG